MPTVLVTGWAGFIGSHLTERLLADGHTVVGIDARSKPDDPAWRDQPRLLPIRGDLLELNLVPLVKDVDYVVHLAGQPGVRNSLGPDFPIYTRRNIETTQRLLMACVDAGVGLQRFILASTSAVYGTAPRPFREDGQVLPQSPYGVTKLAAEHLVQVYRRLHHLPTATLRYFTVYGPRQRPDMAFHRFITAISKGETLPIYGSLEQSRDFTFVTDAVDATVRALTASAVEGQVLNVASGQSVTLSQVLSILSHLAGRELQPSLEAAGPGEMTHTAAAVDRAREWLQFTATVPVAEGLARQWLWHTSLLGDGNP